MTSQRLGYKQFSRLPTSLHSCHWSRRFIVQVARQDSGVSNKGITWKCGISLRVFSRTSACLLPYFCIFWLGGMPMDRLSVPSNHWSLGDTSVTCESSHSYSQGFYNLGATACPFPGCPILLCTTLHSPKTRPAAGICDSIQARSLSESYRPEVLYPSDTLHNHTQKREVDERRRIGRLSPPGDVVRTELLVWLHVPQLVPLSDNSRVHSLQVLSHVHLSYTPCSNYYYAPCIIGEKKSSPIGPISYKAQSRCPSTRTQLLDPSITVQ